MSSMKYEQLHNTRDLGGILTTGGGTIRPGMLIRSGQLTNASFKDLINLKNNVSLVVDFRTEKERFEVPDPELDGIDNIHIPVIDDLAAGVSRDSKSDEEAFRMLAADPEGSLKYMCRTYEGFITSGAAVEGYKRFINMLLEGRDKAILWHCTAGKDRTGFATVLVLEMLGADRDTITENYLKTNEFIEPNVQYMINMFFGAQPMRDPRVETALRNMFGARKEYLDAAYAKAAELYGDFDSYLRNGLKLSQSDIDRMRELYIV